MTKQKSTTEGNDSSSPFLIEESSINPHDSLFKSCFSDPRVIVSFLERHLDPILLERIDLATITLCKDSFITDFLNTRAVDMLYRVELKDKSTCLYIHMEHQSTVDPIMAFRLYQYAAEIIALHIKQYGFVPMPLVRSIVLYHGRRKYYSPVELYSLYGDNRPLAQLCFGTPHILIDLEFSSDEDLKEEGIAGVVQYFLKHSFDHDLLASFDNDIISWLHAIELADGYELVARLLNYSLAVANISCVDTFIERIRNGFTDKTGEMMGTAAQYLENRGHQRGLELGLEEGLEQGLKIGKREVALAMLRNQLDVSVITQLTGLTHQEIDTLIEFEYNS